MQPGGFVMKEIKKMLFTTQRFQILAHFTNSAAEKNLSAAYAYAWDRSVYPLLDEVAPWHKSFAEQFDVQQEDIKELMEYLQECFDKEISITFYELEEHYGIQGVSRSGEKWDRFSLAHACRYLFMHDKYDKDFWNNMMQDSKSPAETKCVIRNFTEEEVHFE